MATTKTFRTKGREVFLKPTLVLATEDRLAGEALTSTLKTKGYDAYIHSQHLNNIDRFLTAHHPSFVLIGETLIHSLGEQLYAAVRSLDYQPRCAFILSSGSAGHVVGGLQNGVRGFVSSSLGLRDLYACLQALEKDCTYISPEFSGAITWPKREEENLKEHSVNLTPREEQILSLVGQNKTSRQIGALLNLSPKTIQNHRQNICNKLGLRGRNKLYEYAVKHFRDK